MKSNNKFKFIIPIIVLLIFMASIYSNKKTQNNTPTNVDTNSSTSKLNTKQQNTAANQRLPLVTDRRPANAPTPISLPIPNDDTIKLLEDLEINYQKDYKMINQDIWYVSDKYSIVPTTAYNNSMGEIKVSSKQSFVVNMERSTLKDSFPPAVVSYASGGVVDLTGDIIVQYNGGPQTSISFIKKNIEDVAINNHPKLQEIKALHLTIKDKSNVVEIFEKLNVALKNGKDHQILKIELAVKYLYRHY